MRIEKQLIWGAVVVAAALACSPCSTEAVPAFSRDMEVSCTVCHTVWPQLTEEGRLFKEAGYESEDLVKIDQDLTLPKPFPISARLNLRPVDKRTSKRKASGELSDKDQQFKTRALHEVEVFLAGKAHDDWSYFVEIEAEDEWPDPAGDAPGFQIQLATGAVQYKPSANVTLAAGYASPFYSDPYNAVNHHKPARHDWAPSNRGFVPSESQFISISGRPTERVFVLAAFHGNGGRLEGNDPMDFSGRLVADVSSNVSVGGYATLQQTYDPAAGQSDSDDKVNRFGGDLQANYDELNFHALFGVLDHDASDTMENVVALEANYLAEVGSRQIGPVASISRYTINDGDDSFVEASLFLNYQFTANVRVQVGWEGDLSVPDMYEHKESRITAVVDLGL